MTFFQRTNIPGVVACYDSDLDITYYEQTKTSGLEPYSEAQAANPHFNEHTFFYEPTQIPGTEACYYPNVDMSSYQQTETPNNAPYSEAQAANPHYNGNIFFYEPTQIPGMEAYYPPNANMSSYQPTETPDFAPYSEAQAPNPCFNEDMLFYQPTQIPSARSQYDPNVDVFFDQQTQPPNPGAYHEAAYHEAQDGHEYDSEGVENPIRPNETPIHNREEANCSGPTVYDDASSDGVDVEDIPPEIPGGPMATTDTEVRVGGPFLPPLPAKTTEIDEKSEFAPGLQKYHHNLTGDISEILLKYEIDFESIKFCGRVYIHDRDPFPLPISTALIKAREAKNSNWATAAREILIYLYKLNFYVSVEIIDPVTFEPGYFLSKPRPQDRPLR